MGVGHNMEGLGHQAKEDWLIAGETNHWGCWKWELDMINALFKRDATVSSYTKTYSAQHTYIPWLQFNHV